MGRYKILYLPTGEFFKDGNCKNPYKDDVIFCDSYEDVDYCCSAVPISIFFEDIFHSDVLKNFPGWCHNNGVTVKILKEHLVIYNIDNKGEIINENFRF